MTANRNLTMQPHELQEHLTSINAT